MNQQQKQYPGKFFDLVLVPIVIVGTVFAIVGIVGGWF